MYRVSSKLATSKKGVFSVFCLLPSACTISILLTTHLIKSVEVLSLFLINLYTHSLTPITNREMFCRLNFKCPTSWILLSNGKSTSQLFTRRRRRTITKDPKCFLTSSRSSSTTSSSTNSSSRSSEEHLQHAAQELASMFHLDSVQSMAIVKHLSPSARKEVCAAQQKLLQVEALSPGGTATPEPSKRDLRIHALTQGIPFIGFGIMDNAILIWAGDQIDTHLGVIFGISTLCAAAIGNIISDLAGLGLGAYIEDFCATKLNLPKINFSNAQRKLRSVRMAGQWGNCIGLTLGCIIGMFPLLLIDPDEVQFRKQDAKIFGIFRDVMNEAKTLVSADSTCLFLVVDDDKSTIPAHYNRKLNSYEKKYLYGKYCCNDKKTKKRLCVPVGRGIISEAIMSGEIVNVHE